MFQNLRPIVVWGLLAGIFAINFLFKPGLDHYNLQFKAAFPAYSSESDKMRGRLLPQFKIITDQGETLSIGEPTENGRMTLLQCVNGMGDSVAQMKELRLLYERRKGKVDIISFVYSYSRKGEKDNTGRDQREQKALAEFRKLADPLWPLGRASKNSDPEKVAKVCDHGTSSMIVTDATGGIIKSYSGVVTNFDAVAPYLFSDEERGSTVIRHFGRDLSSRGEREGDRP